MPLGLIVHDDFVNRKGFEAIAQGNGPALGRELEIAHLLSFIKHARIRNVVWLTADVHYTAAHFYDPNRARFPDFEPFWEFVSGLLHAGTFGPNELDDTFGPQPRFLQGPKARARTCRLGGDAVLRPCPHRRPDRADDRDLEGRGRRGSVEDHSGSCPLTGSSLPRRCSCAAAICRNALRCSPLENCASFNAENRVPFSARCASCRSVPRRSVMLWSIPIARIAGTVVRVHVTFLLFLVWIGAAQWRQGGPEAATESVVFMALLFACVLAHEFGHIIAARRYGIRTPDVTLWPIGGVASLERIPDKPRRASSWRWRVRP